MVWDSGDHGDNGGQLCRLQQDVAPISGEIELVLAFFEAEREDLEVIDGADGEYDGQEDSRNGADSRLWSAIEDAERMAG